MDYSWEQLNLGKHEVRGRDTRYLERGGQVVFQEPELDGGFGVAKNRQHHYSEGNSSAFRKHNMEAEQVKTRDYVKQITY